MGIVSDSTELPACCTASSRVAARRVQLQATGQSHQPGGGPQSAEVVAIHSLGLVGKAKAGSSR